ncbi:DUF4331 domain-containing protein, partial [Okeania hirsuta]
RPGDEIIYRFTFTRNNEDPTTFFNIRLGKINIRTTYTMERSIDGGASFQTIVQDESYRPLNRSRQMKVELSGTTYESLMTGHHLYQHWRKGIRGPADDPFLLILEHL